MLCVIKETRPMIFGIPRELKDRETRVGAGLIPRNVAALVA